MGFVHIHMKKYIFAFLMLFTVTQAKADFTTSPVFEPLLICAVGGTVGYVVSPTPTQWINAAIFCGAGALTGVILNAHYDNKFGRKYQSEIASKDKIISEFRMARARKSAKGEYEPFVNDIVEVVPGQCFSDGSCQAETFKVRQKMPGTEDRVGD
jgi:hypothetical protein